MPRFLGTVLLLLASYAPAFAAAPKPLNLVFILADDLGWSDTTLYGQTKFYETPNLQRLARRGMLFSNAYAANPLCSPTRASILTGLYPGRIGITTPSGHLPEVKLEATLAPRTIFSNRRKSASPLNPPRCAIYRSPRKLSPAPMTDSAAPSMPLAGETIIRARYAGTAR